jgi:hypothetical protein
MAIGCRKYRDSDWCSDARRERASHARHAGVRQTYINTAAGLPAAVRLGCPIFRPSITLPATVKVQCDDAELASRERQLGTSWTFYAISS